MEILVMAMNPAGDDDELGRRAFLSGAVGSMPTMLAANSSSARAVDPPGGGGTFPGLAMRERQPLNLEFPFPTLDSVVTPTNRFFVRNHFPMPTVDMTTWRLKVDGEVRHELELSYDELRKLPARTMTATIECAGNNRALLVPKVKGMQWELGAVGNAEWTGVPLAAILDKAGLKAGAVEVVLEGADRGEVNDDPKTPGIIHYERSLPLDKAKRPEVLLAYKMNGQDLSPEHGFPLRAVVAGWYGMASVKWLTRLSVIATPFRGYMQTIEYTYWRRDQGRPTMVPVTNMQCKAEIARPALHESIPAGTTYRVFGAAWAGESDVAKVDVSADGGKTWQPARLLGDAAPYTWRLWEYNWQTPTMPGRYHLMARATDQHGQTQSPTRSPDSRTYMICHLLPVEVEVR